MLVPKLPCRDSGQVVIEVFILSLRGILCYRGLPGVP